MERTGKKRLLFVLCTAFALLSALALAACGSAPTEIYIGRSDMPRLTYVQGQELDLSQGVLTVSYSDGSAQTLPLDGEGVTVSGYDGNAVGTQTVTIGYSGLTTTIDVTVIARAQVVGATTVYYEGESFDASRGSMRIANDDASTFDVPLSDGAVTVSGFDSSAPASSQTVTATYAGEGGNCSAQFEVSIYSTENARLTPPNKTSYQSHEEFRVNGAYITYSNGDPAYDKTIPVTDDMVSGIDFSTVTEENSPATLTGVVTYGGREYPFTVTVTYSPVTALQRLLEEYAFTWTEPDIPAVDDARGAQAAECVEQYVALSVAQRSYIDRTSIQAAARTAAVWAYGKWSAALAACDGAFVYDEEGLKFRLFSYADTASSYAAVSAQDNALNAQMGLLSDLASVFGTVTVGGTAMEDYLAYVTSYSETREQLLAVLQLTSSLYEAVEDVPADWTAEGLSDYKTGIDAARDLVTEGDFASGAYREVYALVSSWREKNDLFDILYAYYTAQSDTESIDSLKNIILPAALEELFVTLVSSVTEHTAIIVESDGGYSSDTTYAVYYYRRALELAEAIDQGSDELAKTLYSTLTFDNLLSDSTTGEPIPTSFDDFFLYLYQTVYLGLVSGVLDDDALCALWDDYLAVCDAQTQSEAEPLLKQLLADFVALSPAQQFSFLYSVNYYYDGYLGHALDTQVNYTFLIRSIRSVWQEALTEPEFEAMSNLLLAVEAYANVGGSGTAVTLFLDYFSKVQAVYDQMASDGVFRRDFGAIYEQYASVAALYNADGSLKQTPVLDEEAQALLDAFVAQVRNIVAATEEDSIVYIRLFGAYERAREYSAQILSSENDALLEAYYRSRIAFGSNVWTPDYAMSMVASWSALSEYAGLSYGDVPVIEFLSEQLRAFLADANAVLWAQETACSAADAAAAMKAFIALTDTEKDLFWKLQAYGDAEYYYDGLAAVFEAAFSASEALKAAADALAAAEQAMLAYTEAAADEDADALAAARTALDSAMSALEQAVGQLNAQESDEFDALFSSVLSYYREAYAALE